VNTKVERDKGKKEAGAEKLKKKKKKRREGFPRN